MNSAESKENSYIQRAINALRAFYAAPWFPFFLAGLTLLCYYTSLDMVLIWFIALSGTFILLFSKDTSPLITLFLFMNIMISMKNSPTLVVGTPDDYYFQPHIIAQLCAGIVLFAGSGVWRFIVALKHGKISFTPALAGLAAFAAGIMFNGAFSSGYTPMNLAYGFFIAFLFLGVFAICSGSMRIDKNTYRRVALSFFALSICLVVELIVAYCTYDMWNESGGIDRIKLYFGWGMYNTMGMLLVISLPSAAYLALNVKKFGWAFTVYLVVLLCCAFLSLSRQAMICGSLIFIVCAVWLIIKCKRYRAVNLCIFAAAAVVAVIFVFVNIQSVKSVFEMLTNNFFFGSGRSTLYEKALNAFFSNPVFGTGFYRDLPEDPGFVGLPIVPDMYHNTIFELIAVGGAAALVPYVIHRVQTIISFVKNPSEDRFYVALTIAALLILSLLDNHIFYLLPTTVYSFLTALLIGSEGVGADGRAKLLHA